MKLDVALDNTFNAYGGFMAAILINAEMYGMGAIIIKAIMDEHVITSEGLKAYGPVVVGLMGK